MNKISCTRAVALLVLLFGSLHAVAQPASPGGVKTLSPSGAIKPTGTWSLGTRAGDFVFVAGMRGIDPSKARSMHRRNAER